MTLNLSGRSRFARSRHLPQCAARPALNHYQRSGAKRRLRSRTARLPVSLTLQAPQVDWAPAVTMGGAVFQLCFSATTQCGACNCRSAGASHFSAEYLSFVQPRHLLPSFAMRCCSLTERSGSQQSTSACVSVSVAKCALEVHLPASSSKRDCNAITRAGAARLQRVVAGQSPWGDVESPLAAQHRSSTPRLCLAGALLFMLTRSVAQWFTTALRRKSLQPRCFCLIQRPQPATMLFIGRLITLPQAR